MRQTKLLVLILLVSSCTLALAPRESEAQILPRSLEVDLFGGYYFFGGNLENLQNGPLLGGRLGINFLEYVSLPSVKQVN